MTSRLVLAALLSSSFACSPGGAEVRSPDTTAAPPTAMPSGSGAGTVGSPAPLEMAITVDDLPVHGPLVPGVSRLDLAEKLISVFAKHRVPPVFGFVNGKRVLDDPTTEAVLERWVRSGNQLGNHTFSHVSLNGATLADYLADLDRGETILKKLVPEGRSYKYFRYPFLFEGDTVEKRDGVRAYLRDHGYVVAEVTVEADDWAFNAPFARCTERGDRASLADLHRTFVEVHLAELEGMRVLTRDIEKRDVKQILLLHIGVAEADAIDDLLTAYEAHGVRWIDLPTALADPFYQREPGEPAKYGAAFPYRLAKQAGVKPPKAAFETELESRLEKLCN